MQVFGAAGAYAGVGNWLNIGGYDGITFTTGNADIASQTERMRIDSLGSVGIGTNDPDYTLHLLKSSGDTEMYINGQNGQSSLRMGLDARNWQIKTAAAPYLWSLNYVGTDVPLSNIITANVGGNVGIGTDSPDAKLDISQNMTAGTTAAFTSPHLSLTALNSTDNTGFVGMTFATSDNTNYGWSWGALRSNGGLGSMILRNHYNSAQGTEVLTIDSSGNSTFSGNVNIIASNSSTGSSVSPKMLIYNEGAGDSALQLAVSGSISYYLGVDNTDNTFKIGNASWDSSPFMAINTSGNVGIGNTNPSDYGADANNLVVGSLTGNNGITILSTATDGYGSIYFADGTTGSEYYSGYISYQQNQSNMSFGTNGAERMRITSGGTVELKGSATPRITFIPSSGATLTGTIYQEADKVYIGRLGVIDIITVDLGGNVGIGVNPSQKLEVNGAAKWFGATSTDFSQTGGQIDYYDTGRQFRFNSYKADSTGAGIAFNTGGTTSYGERVRVTSSGNTFFNYSNETIETYGSGAYGGKVVIKASDDQALALLSSSIGGTAHVALNFTNEFVANQYNYLARIKAEPETVWDSTAANRNSRLTFSTNNAGTIAERMRITSGGIIQNESTTSTASGAVRFSNNNFYWGMMIEDDALSTGFILFSAQNGDSVGSITRNGALNTSFNTVSDYRLKEDLQDFEGLDMVSKIPVYDFKWKPDESRSYGVMAHELQEVLPDAVVGDKDAEEMQQVDYSKIVPLLIKAIQELKAEIEILKNK
jgi:hypothetical protein